VILVAAMRKVHAHHVKASLTKLVDSLDRVRLGTNGADDGGAAEGAVRLVRRVERRQPLNLTAKVKMIESRSSHCN